MLKYDTFWHLENFSHVEIFWHLEKLEVSQKETTKNKWHKIIEWRNIT